MFRHAGARGDTDGDAADLPQARVPAPARTSQELDDVVRHLYLTHAVTMVRLANLLVRDRASAEDIVQDAFLSLYRALPRLRGTVSSTASRAVAVLARELREEL
jgi:Sigma-70 region 2